MDFRKAAGSLCRLGTHQLPPWSPRAGQEPACHPTAGTVPSNTPVLETSAASVSAAALHCACLGFLLQLGLQVPSSDTWGTTRLPAWHVVLLWSRGAASRERCWSAPCWAVPFGKNFTVPRGTHTCYGTRAPCWHSRCPCCHPSAVPGSLWSSQHLPRCSRLFFPMKKMTLSHCSQYPYLCNAVGSSAVPGPSSCAGTAGGRGTDRQPPPPEIKTFSGIVWLEQPMCERLVTQPLSSLSPSSGTSLLRHQ